MTKREELLQVATQLMAGDNAAGPQRIYHSAREAVEEAALLIVAVDTYLAKGIASPGKDKP